MIRAGAFLLPFVVALPLSTASILAGAQQRPLTVDQIFGHGSIIGTPPQQITWSPNGKHLTYIDSGGEMDEVDVATGRTHVMISRQKLAPLMRQDGTEQDLDHRLRYHMASYFWAPDEKRILFDSDGALWIYSLENGTGVQVAFTNAASGDDPKFSPDGTMISFVRGGASLVVVRLRESGTPEVVVAPSQKPEILNGAVDWVYEEELDVRSNYHWSPDSKNLAFLQMDEAAVPQYPLVDWIPVHPTVSLQRYPQPGDPNPDVRLGVVSAKGGRVIWVKVPFENGEDYIPRFGWVDAKTVWVETLSRDQKHRTLYFVEAASGESQKMLEIDDDKFLDDNYDVFVERGHIVLSDWASGHNQVYLYSYDQDHPLSHSAKLARQLTSGDYEVDEVYNVDHEASVVDYSANEGNPLEQQLWEVNFDGEHRQLSSGAGFHEGNFATAGGGYVDKQSTRMSPPKLSVCREVGICRVFWETRAIEEYHLRAPEQLEVKASDGTKLYATLLEPEGAKANASVPLIVNPYGGPGDQVVQNRWSDDLLFDDLLAQRGFAVLHADNRGMGGRGRAFAQDAWHNFGPVQLQDQLTVIDAALKQHPELDPKRLGWWGWSWGGTFTIYAMTHSDRFRAGVAVAPVTNWRNYDSIYTERYLSTPSEFPQGYKDFSVISSAANLKGDLLLVHGTGDDNVHFQNTVQFVQALIDAKIPYGLEIFPRKTHSLRGPEVRTDLYRSILRHFEKDLMPGADQGGH
ncbi:MAG TPA: alpha/beta fold hydrolase [Terracidiphilus sp.]|nr:alpha/beta fold hydrolase [Terracidiphilus sp.]